MFIHFTCNLLKITAEKIYFNAIIYLLMAEYIFKRKANTLNIMRNSFQSLAAYSFDRPEQCES